MKRTSAIGLVMALLLGAGTAVAEEKRDASPRGTSSTQVGGKRTMEKPGAEARYSGGKWIDVDYGRPIKRGRESLFGAGAEYGKKVSDGAPVWRAGANQTTRFKTEVPLEFAGKKLAPGEYSLFVDLKEGAWTLVLSTQPAQQKYDPSDKSAIWGSYGYEPKFDVLRMPMKMLKTQHSVDQFTIGFLDVTDRGGELAMAWDHDVAMAHFTVSQ